MLNNYLKPCKKQKERIKTKMHIRNRDPKVQEAESLFSQQRIGNLLTRPSLLPRRSLWKPGHWVVALDILILRSRSEKL